MEKKNKKSGFYKTVKLTKIDNIDVNKVLVCREEPYGSKNSFKYFIGYNDDDFIRPLCTELPDMVGYADNFENNKIISFKISDKQL